MSARESNRRRVLSPEERVLWSTVTRSIPPLRDVEIPTEDEVAAQAAPSPAPVKRAAATDAAPVPAAPPLAPLGRRLRARVARGKEAIDARLDLHGMTQSEAHAALLHFLRSASARGARLTLVITGKGQRSEGEGGVLRRQVPHWLRLPEFRAFVIGFEEAHIAHGGEGALYVRIRRARGE